MGGLNPYSLYDIGNSRKLFPKTGGDTGDIPETFTRLFPDFAISEFHEYLPIKKYFPTKTGHESVHTEVWLFRKLFSISGNIFQYLEIVSGNSSAPLPEFSEFQILWVTNRFFSPVSFELECFYKVR